MNNLNVFQKELEKLINKHSLENYWNMPDYLMAKMITDFIESASPAMRMSLEWNRGMITQSDSTMDLSEDK